MIEDMAMLVTLDVSNVAVSETPFGTVAGVQLVALFQSRLVGFVAQVALPQKAKREVRSKKAETKSLRVLMLMFVLERSAKGKANLATKDAHGAVVFWGAQAAGQTLQVVRVRDRFPFPASCRKLQASGLCSPE
jgi:hypothetical protein